MQHLSKRTERIHSLDALRAVMMLLGVVLHSTEPYSLGSDPFWAKDTQAAHSSMNFIFGIIHLFRMPIFFLMAGFFGALLFYRKGEIATGEVESGLSYSAGPQRMLKNRFLRLVLPFAVFLLLLHPVIILAFNYAAGVFGSKLTPLISELTLLPQITYHLWFLYYLILITAITFVLAMVLKQMPGITKKVCSCFEWLLVRRIVFIPVFSIIMFLILVWMWDTWIFTPLLFSINLPVLCAYLMYYVLGWLLYKSRHLLNSFKKNDWLFTIIGVLVFTLRFFLRDYVDDILYGALNAVLVWLFLFGITGLFIRYFSGHSERMRYVSDSSYWVYLIHLPLVALFSGLIAQWPISGLAKFFVVMIATSMLCFATYQFLVRSTFIGKFLNGRKYSR